MAGALGFSGVLLRSGAEVRLAGDGAERGELRARDGDLVRAQIGRASCRGKSVDLGGRRLIKKKKKTISGAWQVRWGSVVSSSGRVPKPGWRVRGRSAVNSGHEMAISYAR